jgi:hypothetical protein
VKTFLKGSEPSVNVVQHLRDFGRFWMNKLSLGRQREDRNLVVEEKILHEIEKQPRTGRLANHLGVCSLPASSKRSAAQEIRQNRGILNWVGISWKPRVALKLAWQTMASILSNFLEVSFYTFTSTHNYSHFTLLFKPLLFSE